MIPFLAIPFAARARRRAMFCATIAAGVVLLSSLAPVRAAGAPPVHYTLDLRDTRSHHVRVTMTIPDAPPATSIQFPAWNALYQIRDFVRNVDDVRAECDSRGMALVRVDLDTWRTGSQACSILTVRYAVYANQEGPFSTVLNDHHSFMNLAMLLFYLPEGRDRPARVNFILPKGWELATLLEDTATPGEFSAPNYDALVDSPSEAGHFSEYDYQQSGATFRVIVDADRKDYSAQRLLDSLEKITATETAMMQDVPFSRYTFIFHFPAGSGGGGMEHLYGTAITLPAATVQDNWGGLDAVAAHEFFHLWNVKRIRPAALEPVDYVHGNDTRDLWFSEGVTSTYQELTLERAGLTTPQEFYRRLAYQIGILQGRPARLFQSVEEAGRSAWLEKYLDYLRPDRSISYYNKGQLVGYLLDLAIRRGSHNAHSLDDLMRQLNRDFAKRHRFFTQADLRTIASELAPGFTDVDDFFRDYVSGTKELDYDEYLRYAGLRLVTTTAAQASLGFRAARSFDGPITVESVDAGSNAARAGLEKGDVLVEMNGRTLTSLPDQLIANTPSSAKIEFQVQRGNQTLRVKYRQEKTDITSYRVEEISNPTADQLRLRQGWLEGKTDSAAGQAHP
jgi:predicted metalloprotease with PDZ domain